MHHSLSHPMHHPQTSSMMRDFFHTALAYSAQGSCPSPRDTTCHLPVTPAIPRRPSSRTRLGIQDLEALLLEHIDVKMRLGLRVDLATVSQAIRCEGC